MIMEYIQIISSQRDERPGEISNFEKEEVYRNSLSNVEPDNFRIISQNTI